MPAPNPNLPPADGVTLRRMTAADLDAAHALSTEMRWPHRPADWEQAFRHAEGFVAERDGQTLGTALRFRWGPQHATLGLIIVTAAAQGRRIGHRLMSALLDGLDNCHLLLHATLEGRGLYERLGFQRTGELRQHQGIALPAPRALDAQARGMPRDALVDELVADAEAAVVLDEGGSARGFGLLRRFGRGHVIGPIVAPDAEGAKALIAHLAGLNAGRFTRIDIDAASGLAEWVESLGLARVDAPVTMQRGGVAQSDARPGAPRLFAIVTQAIG
jgi:predicted N-acetyltransferase YhbS